MPARSKFLLSPEAPVAPQDAPIILSTRWRGVNDSAVTRYNPQPIASQSLTIPVLATVPNASSGQSKPPGGWPVVIFQHGITQDRTNVLAVADTLASAGFAAIAIDLPLHGITDTENPFYAGPLERTFNVDLVNNEAGAPEGPDGMIDGSGTHYISLTSSLTTRDNVRQGVTDPVLFDRHAADSGHRRRCPGRFCYADSFCGSFLGRHSRHQFPGGRE
ncbi:MAG: hypothetical protein R3F37_15170 [Candidatus Competibacteraceae bacterium]